MRIVHFYSEGAVQCGVLDERGRVRGLNEEPTLAGLSAGEQLDRLLTLDKPSRQTLNAELMERAPVAMERADRLAPAVPNPPLYYYMHGNAPTVFKRQTGGKGMWELARSPHNRIRPWSSIAGTGQQVSMSQGAALSTGTEFAVVIGAPASRVGATEAADHIAGIVATNDGFLSGLHAGFETSSSIANTVHTQAMHTLFKSSDGMGGIGPCIVTIEEVEALYIERVGSDRLALMQKTTGRLACLYDLLTRNYRDGKCIDRSHTGALLLDAEYLIAYLSRFMTLRTGSIIGLGSAGWDGQHSALGAAEGSIESAAFEIEDFGRYYMHLTRTGVHDLQRKSPLIADRVSLGLPAMPSEQERSTRALWMARGNGKDAGTIDNVPEGVGMCPFLMPWSAMGDDHSPIVIPPHATHVDVAVQLAVVMGDEAAYNVPVSDAMKYVRGFAVMLAMRDRSLVELLPAATDYEARPAYLAGHYADGFFRIGPTMPIAGIDWRKLRMRVFDDRGREAICGAADYRFGFAHMIAMVSRTITLLPGDVLSLGRAGDVLTLASDALLPAGAKVGAEIDSLGRIELPVRDHRNALAQSDNAAFLRPTR